MNVYENNIEVRGNDLYYINEASIVFHFHSWERPTDFTAAQFATILSLAPISKYSTAQEYAAEIESHMALNHCEGTFDCYPLN